MTEAPETDEEPSRWTHGDAGIYLRVSSTDQLQGMGLEIQKDKCLDYCHSRDWRHRLYEERGLSGSSLDRPVLDRMLEDAQRGKFDTILVYRLDRLARSNRDLQNLYSFLKDLGISLVSATEAFDDSLNGKLLFDLAGSISEWERGIIRQRTQSGMRKRVERGRWKGGQCAYGYHYIPKTKGVDDGTLKITKGEAAVVKLVFRRFMELRNLSDVAKELNTIGHRTTSGGKFTHAHIKNILTRTMYKGMMTYGDITVELPDLRIISDEEFEKAQYLLARVSKGRQSKRKFYQKKEYCFRCNRYVTEEMMYCPQCGTFLVNYSEAEEEPEVCVCRADI